MKKIIYGICLILGIFIIVGCGLEKEVGVTLVTDTMEVEYVLVNKDFLDKKLFIVDVVLSKDEVVFEVPNTYLSNVDSIKAIIDLETANINGGGTYTLDNLKLVAYDNNGKALDYVRVVATISAQIEVSSYSKEVPIKVVPTGELATGKGISSITVDGMSVENYSLTIYGAETALGSISYIPVNVDVHGYGNEKNKNFNVVISKPKGVNALSKEKVSVSLGFSDAIQKEVTVQGLGIKNLGDGLQANLTNHKDSIVNVKLMGTESLLNDPLLTLTAHVDVNNLKAGTYTLPVMVECSDSRVVAAVAKQVNVVISEVK